MEGRMPTLNVQIMVRERSLSYVWVGVGVGAGPKHYIVKSDSGLGLLELGLDWIWDLVIGLGLIINLL